MCLIKKSWVLTDKEFPLYVNYYSHTHTLTAAFRLWTVVRSVVSYFHPKTSIESSKRSSVACLNDALRRTYYKWQVWGTNTKPVIFNITALHLLCTVTSELQPECIFKRTRALGDIFNIGGMYVVNPKIKTVSLFFVFVLCFHVFFSVCLSFADAHLRHSCTRPLVAFKSFQWMGERSSACLCFVPHDQAAGSQVVAADFAAHLCNEKTGMCSYLI